MACAKQVDNPLIHKPTHCHAVSVAAEEGKWRRSLCSLSYLPNDSVSESSFLYLLPLCKLYLSLSLWRGDCAACECNWFGCLAGVWPGLTHLLPGGLLQIPSKLSLRFVSTWASIWVCIYLPSMFGPSKNFLGVVAEILVFILEKKSISAYLDMSVVFFSPSSTL